MLSRAPVRKKFPSTVFSALVLFGNLVAHSRSFSLPSASSISCASYTCNERHRVTASSIEIKNFGVEWGKGTVGRTQTSLGATAIGVASTATAAAASFPQAKVIVAASCIPALFGFYKSEYGVSYGYGTAVSASAFLILRALLSASGNSSVALVHAAALVFYGVRLNAFLLYRELFLQTFRDLREKIEERAVEKGSRLSRTPFLLSCGMLYFCLVAPLLVTSRLCADIQFWASYESKLLLVALRSSIIVAWAGFVLGAVGDATKSICKALKGEDYLVTGGVFRFLRHPNYTGEMIGWASSCLAAFLAVANASCDPRVWARQTPYLASSLLGAMGIVFILSNATIGLEGRQKEKYSSSPDYKDWVKRSWAGLMLRRGENNKSND